MMLDFSKTKFLYSAVDKKIKHNKFQIALMGRSNVGKSSLINDLCQSKNLAKTSSKPGKTQLINFFEISCHTYLVDLPGYGYAKVPQKIRDNFFDMIDNYVTQNKENLFVVVLLDIRHDPTKNDIQLIEWLDFHNIRFTIVFTKCDKVSSNKLIGHAEKILDYFPTIRKPTFLFYSIKDKKSRKALTQTLNQELENGTN